MLVVQEPLHSDNHIAARCARWWLRIPRNRLSLQELLNLCLYSLRRGVTSEIQPTCFLVSLFSFGDSGEEHASSLIQLLAEFSSCGCRTGSCFLSGCQPGAALSPGDCSYSFLLAPFTCRVSNGGALPRWSSLCSQPLTSFFSAISQRKSTTFQSTHIIRSGPWALSPIVRSTGLGL